MPPDTIKKSVQLAYRNISKSIDDFRNRYTQRALIAEIVKTVCDDNTEHKILIAEGPTGTGKTLAYLLASIPVSELKNKNLIISSATVALQSQLINKDLPLVQKNSGLEFTAVLAKGRSRYLCPSRLEQQCSDIITQTDAFADEDYLTKTLRELDAKYADNSWNGDKDEWPNGISDDVWVKISNDRHGCLGPRCHLFNECPYFVARGKIEKADVIIANHDLVLSDLALGGGILLPEPEDTIYVFDEAHHLPDKTVNHSASWASTSGTKNWLDKSENTIKLSESALMECDTGKLFSSIDQCIIDLKASLADFINYLSSIPELKLTHEVEATHRFPQGIIDEALRLQATELLKYANQTHKQLSKLKERLTKAVNDNEIASQLAESVLPELGANLSRLENLATLCNNLVKKDNNDEPPMARWITSTSLRDSTDYRISTSPISAANFLNENLWQRCNSAILTSATLRSLGDFSYFQQKAGLVEIESARYIHLASPFDFENRATLWIPEMKSEPAQTRAHTDEIIELLPDLIAQTGGTLILFSSRRQLSEVAEQLPAHIRECLLVQGDYNLHTLLNKHRDRIEEGEASVIMGLASFAEGIDLPGDLCTHVIIAKLPFPVPDSPVDATEREYIEAQGKNHFREIVLPLTSIKLTQAVGRLIRHEDDSGKVTILDRRLVSKFYGKQLLNTLPPMQKIID